MSGECDKILFSVITITASSCRRLPEKLNSNQAQSSSWPWCDKQAKNWFFGRKLC